MNPFQNPDLSDCGACTGLTTETPVEVYNRPGLSAVAYRTGDHSQFKASLLARLSSSELPALGGLKTRDDMDFSIALLDGWATVSDVLTFYQERIANESYLRTATERRSIEYLARLVGYELKPGVAASTYLAFTLETAPGSPGYATIEKGTKVQSIPGPNEVPQTFETVEKLDAKAEWNELRPQMFERRIPGLDAKEVHLKGVATGLKPGDGLLFVGSERQKNPQSDNWDFRFVKTVSTYPNADPNAAYTKVTWDKGLGWKGFNKTVLPAKENFKIYAFRQRANLFGYNAPNWRTLPDSVRNRYLPNKDSETNTATEWPDLNIISIAHPDAAGSGTGLYGQYYNQKDLTKLEITQVDPIINFDWGIGSPNPLLRADNFSIRWTGQIQPRFSEEYTFYTISDDGVRLWIDGNRIIDKWNDQSATEWSGKITLVAGQTYPIQLEYYENTGDATIKLYWSSNSQTKELIPQSQLSPYSFASFISTVDTIYLDNLYPQILPGSWLLLATPDYDEIYEVKALADDSRNGFALTAKTTRVKLSGENLKEKFNEHIRETVAYAQSEELELAPEPITKSIEGDNIVLDRLILSLTPGQTFLISGKRPRARILTTNLNLTSFDKQNVDLKPGDSLLIMQPTISNAGKEVWLLKDSKGFIGTVTVNPGDIILEASQKDDETISEVVRIDSISDAEDRSTLKLSKPFLVNSYDRTTVTINANVALSTHGEAVNEVLGSGDASQSFQHFTLRQPPLTYTSAATPSGTESTLEVRVNDLLWQEVPTLFGHGPHEHIYTTRIDENGMTVIRFGDGITGARLPTGRENVRATYRKGIGLSGLLKARQLRLLMTRPLGVKDVDNPIAPAGAADPEPMDEARRNAPTTVLTLDRVVSLQDYEDFASTYAGVAKALASWVWSGEMRGVLVTIAGAQGKEISKGDVLRNNLSQAIQLYGDPNIPLQVTSYKPIYFQLSARIKTDPAYLPEKVKKAAEDALRSYFSFDARHFGQPVFLSEVITVIQNTPGVIMADVTRFYRTDIGEQNSLIPPRLSAAIPNAEDGLNADGAELLTLDPGPITLEVMP